MNYYLSVLKNYAMFDGRARRSEYWYFYLFNLIFLCVAWILGSMLKLGMILYIIYALAVIVPGLAVTVRRLHDTGKSGWMIFVNFIPFAGAIWFIILMCMDSIPGDNMYGPNPKGMVATIPITPVQTAPTQPVQPPIQTQPTVPPTTPTNI